VLTSLRMGAYQLTRLERVPPTPRGSESVELVKRSRRTSAGGLVKLIEDGWRSSIGERSGRRSKSGPKDARILHRHGLPNTRTPKCCKLAWAGSLRGGDDAGDLR